ncbi:putative kinesin-like protein [Plasmopara halstedii]
MSMKVIIRTRPSTNFATQQLQINPEENTINVNNRTAASGGTSPIKMDVGPSNRKECWQFKFHQILHNAGQDRVHQAIARDIIHDAVVKSINGTIMAYGQIGAGKSFTMIGDTRNYQYRGIAPRAIAQLFQEVEDCMDSQFTVRVSYLEIYNDHLYDLLGDPKRDINGDLVVVEDRNGTNVRGLTQIEVHSEQEALDQLFYGELQRSVSEHQLNKRSNRSHSILTFHIAQKSCVEGMERVALSKLHLVDLAGSERLKKTVDGDLKSLKDTRAGSFSKIRKESMYINQSLSFLEQCIVALGSKEPRYIPYRQTKLTNILKDSLGGMSNTLIFACIRGEACHLEETLSTLKLATRMMQVQNEVATTVQLDPVQILRKYERQIRELQHELVMRDALVEGSAIVCEELTLEQRQALQQMARLYIEAPTQKIEDETLQFSSVQDIREIFRQFKLLVKSSGIEPIGMERVLKKTGDAANSSTLLKSSSEGGCCSQEVVGEEKATALGPGAVRSATVDTGKTAIYQKAEVVINNPDLAEKQLQAPSMCASTDNELFETSRDERNIEESNCMTNGASLVKNDAFQVFRTTGPGRELYQNLQHEKDKLFEAKQSVKQTACRVNASKAQIDSIRVQLEDKRNQRGGEKNRAEKHLFGVKEIVDEDEFTLMTAEREAKRQYRSIFRDLRDAKDELDVARRSVELLRRRLAREFEDWYGEKGHASAGTTSFDGAYEELASCSKEDKLDDGEKFDQMEIERIRAQDPASLAFFLAQKKMRHQARAMKPASQRKAKH